MFFSRGMYSLQQRGPDERHRNSEHLKDRQQGEVKPERPDGRHGNGGFQFPRLNLRGVELFTRYPLVVVIKSAVLVVL